MSFSEIEVLKLLKTGKCLSLEEIAHALETQNLQKIEHILLALYQKGIPFQAFSTRQYALEQGLEYLNKKDIQHYLPTFYYLILEQTEIFDYLPSTNTYLLEKKKTKQICFAEMQTAGRGRSDKSWISPYARNIYVSFSWNFSAHLKNLPLLSLIIGITVLKMLRKYTKDPSLFIKWPNDILWKNKKIAGILIDTCSWQAKEIYMVLGIGLNVSMPILLHPNISQPWTDIQNIIQKKPSRNYIAALLIQEIFSTLESIESYTPHNFLSQWSKYDPWVGKEITFIQHNHTIHAIHRGINVEGHILLETTRGKIQAFSSGEITLRYEES